MTSTDAATPTTKSKKDFPTSEAGVPLGHKGDGQPLPPFPEAVPLYAIPAPEDRADHDALKAQSGTPEKFEDDFKPAAQIVAPDGPFKDEREGLSDEEREQRRLERDQLRAQPIMDVTPAKAKKS